MPQVLNKENITISIGTYQNQGGETKQRYKTIGELITMQGDDGSTYQFGELWGPTGGTKFNVYQKDDNNQQAQAPQHQQQQAAPQHHQQAPQHQPAQQPYQQPQYPQR